MTLFFESGIIVNTNTIYIFLGEIMIDYRNFRLSKLNTAEYSHLKYLFFWPIYGIVFMLLERFAHFDYTYMHCSLDDFIPFCEYFIVPYLFWFIFVTGMLFYGLFFDTKTFVYYMKLIILTCSAACIMYVIYPSAQNLRPVVFERHNAFTRIIQMFYKFDTNTNVCPSVHVTASMAVTISAWNSKYFRKWYFRLAFVFTASIISISTLFTKQHSVIDVICAILVVGTAWLANAIYSDIKSAKTSSDKKSIFMR